MLICSPAKLIYYNSSLWLYKVVYDNHLTLNESDRPNTTFKLCFCLLSKCLNFYRVNLGRNNDIISFDLKSIGERSFSWHIIVMAVGQNVRTSNININWWSWSYVRWRYLSDWLSAKTFDQRIKCRSNICVHVIKIEFRPAHFWWAKFR